MGLNFRCDFFDRNLCFKIKKEHITAKPTHDYHPIPRGSVVITGVSGLRVSSLITVAGQRGNHTPLPPVRFDNSVRVTIPLSMQ